MTHAFAQVVNAIRSGELLQPRARAKPLLTGSALPALPKDGDLTLPSISTAPVPLPADVVDYITQTFDLANREVSTRIDRMPTTHEENLDFAFIDALASAAGPHVAPSGVVVDFDIHFVGGGAHWGRWEIADLGVIVNFRRARSLIRTKVLLLQSKRLYPKESEFVEFRGLTRLGGFGSLMEPTWLPAQEERTFTFTSDCRYKALQVGDDQWARIKAYEDEHAIPVHYLLYHPSDLPYAREIPTRLPVADRTGPTAVGARVVGAKRCALFWLGALETTLLRTWSSATEQMHPECRFRSSCEMKY